MNHGASLHKHLHWADHMHQLASDPHFAATLRAYHELYGDNPETIEQAPFWNYLTNFVPVKCKIPNTNEDDFDWHLLAILVVASLTLQYRYVFRGGDLIPELEISTKLQGKKVVYVLSSLLIFEAETILQRCIYEQMQMQLSLFQADHGAKIELERKKRIESYRRMSTQAATETSRLRKENENKQWLLGRAGG